MEGNQLAGVGELVGFYQHVIDSKVYYAAIGLDDDSFAIQVYDVRTGETNEIKPIPKTFGWGFTVSPDGRTVLYSQWDQEGADLMLVENFQ